MGKAKRPKKRETTPDDIEVVDRRGDKDAGAPRCYGGWEEYCVEYVCGSAYGECKRVSAKRQ